MSNLTSLFLGVVTIISGYITGSANWVAGSLGIQGNIFFDNTSVTNTEYVGTTPVYQHLVTGLSAVQNGYQTGSTVAVGGAVQQKITPGTCAFGTGGTASGGLANYDFCRARSPFTTTGTIFTLGLECGNVPRPFTLSGSFVKAISTNISANPGQRVFQQFGRGADPTVPTVTTVGTGARIYAFTGAIMWNPADILKIEARSATWNTGNNCSLFYEARDKFGT